MLDGLALAETTPGPLIMVLQFVAFLGAYHHEVGLPPILAGLVGSLLATWVTFAPCFLWIFLGAPYIEALRSNRALNAALSTVTAAVVGVVLNLSVWFTLHTLFANMGRFDYWPLAVEWRRRPFRRFSQGRADGGRSCFFFPCARNGISLTCNFAPPLANGIEAANWIGRSLPTLTSTPEWIKVVTAMRLPFRRRHRRILWIGAALFCLLFQQVAMAAYVCILPEAQRTMALTDTCSQMMATQAHGSTHAQKDPRCAEHCTPNQPTQSDARVPTVPPLVLPFLSPLALGTAAVVPKQLALPDPVQERPQPPPTLRFCTLLI